MNKYFFSYLIVCLVFIAFNSTLIAKDFVGKQRHFRLTVDELMAVAPDAFEAGDPEKVSEAIFAKSPNEILEILKANGLTPRITESTLFISGNRVRVDSEDPDMGKMSVILLPDKDMMYMIQWFNKTYTCMSITELKQMQTKTEQMMEGQFKNLPPQALEALKQYKGMGQATESESGQLKNTGKSGTLNTFRCNEYVGDMGNTKVQAWATEKYPELAKTYEFFMKTMPAGKGDKNEPARLVAEQVPGLWPVITKELEFNMMRGEAELKVEEMLEMNPETVSAEKYEIPDNLTEQKMPSY